LHTQLGSQQDKTIDVKFPYVKQTVERRRPFNFAMSEALLVKFGGRQEFGPHIHDRPTLEFNSITRVRVPSEESILVL
jgi:hypothetical protein